MKIMKSTNFLNIVFLILFPLTAFTQIDNSELQKMYDSDQSSRMLKDIEIDWILLSKQDKEREIRVYKMIEAGQITTSRDYYNSAMIFQHGNDTIASAMAVKHMKKAIELDSTINKWLLAAAIDRDLMRRKKPQIYGTQYVIYNGETKWKRYEIDTTQVTDEQRKFYNVETLAEQLVREREMNLASIPEFYSKSNSIKQTIKFIKSEHKKGSRSKYNISEKELNSFGYELLYSKKETESLEIFILNTKLYPNSFNTYDSLGECLFHLGKKRQSTKAYKKSLELNPKNENARIILENQ